MRCSIKQVFTITCSPAAGPSYSWNPQVERVVDDDGAERWFFNFNKWNNRAFAKAVLGKGMRVSGDKACTINVMFIDTLLRKRKLACLEAHENAVRVDDDGDAASSSKKKRARRSRCNKNAGCLLPAILDLKVDGFEDDDGLQVPITIPVLAKDFTTASIWIELKSDIIEFMIRAIRRDLKEGRSGRTKSRSAGGIELSPRSDDGDDDGEAGDDQHEAPHRVD
jgi:hypothetical protein